METNKDVFTQTFGFEPIDMIRTFKHPDNKWWDEPYISPETNKSMSAINLEQMQTIVSDLKEYLIPKFIVENFENKRIYPTVNIICKENAAILIVEYDDWNKGYYYSKRFHIYPDSTVQDTIDRVMKSIHSDYYMYKEWYSRLDNTEKLFMEGGPWTYEEKDNDGNDKY